MSAEKNIKERGIKIGSSVVAAEGITPKFGDADTIFTVLGINRGQLVVAVKGSMQRLMAGDKWIGHHRDYHQKFVLLNEEK